MERIELRDESVNYYGDRRHHGAGWMSECEVIRVAELARYDEAGELIETEELPGEWARVDAEICGRCLALLELWPHQNTVTAEIGGSKEAYAWREGDQMHVKVVG